MNTFTHCFKFQNLPKLEGNCDVIYLYIKSEGKENYLISGYLLTKVETSRYSSEGSVSLITSAMASMMSQSPSVSSPEPCKSKQKILKMSQNNSNTPQIYK